MIRAVLLTLPFFAAACSTDSSPSVSSLAGPTNMTAMSAAAACKPQEALAIAKGEESSSSPSARLFSQFVQAAVYEDTGNAAEADRILAETTADPSLNPSGLSRGQMDQISGSVLSGIRDERMDISGSATC